MDHEEEFLNTFFTQVTHLCFDKAKESVVSTLNKCFSLVNLGCIIKKKFCRKKKKNYTDQRKWDHGECCL